MNVAVTPPGYISYMRSEIISLVKFMNFTKKNLNLLPGQPDQQEILRSFPKMPSIQALHRIDEAFILRLYRLLEPEIVGCRTLLKQLLLRYPNDLPLWMRKWCKVEPPHSFEFANNYVPVEAMRTKLIDYNTSLPFFQSVMPDYPSVEQLRQANPDEIRKYYDMLNPMIDQVLSANTPN